MGIVVADFETYYAADYTLSQLSTEAYVRDRRFETIGVSLCVDGKTARWYTGEAVAPALAAIDWSTSSLLAYNTAFDGSILGWHYGHYPALYLDAMGMARATGAAFRGASLKAVAGATGAGVKGDYIANTKGMHLHQFKDHELALYGEYCCNDTLLTAAIYRHLLPRFPMSETFTQDCMLRMFIEPTLYFDLDMLVQYNKEVVAAKWRALAGLSKILGMQWEGVDLPDDVDLLKKYDILSDGALIDQMRTILMSNPKFAQLLIGLGVDPPMKISATTGRATYAFAKTDLGLLALQDHDDPKVVAAVTARLGVKSTIEETRSQAFINIAERGAWPAQYNFWAAISSRFSGGGDTNPQNLKRGGTLRDAILAPPGHVLVVGDLSQIECRMVNYTAGQDDVIEAFRAFDAGTGPDVYCIFASRLHGRTITPDDKEPRQAGKTAELSLGYGGGSEAYKRMLFAQAGLHTTLDKAQRVVDIYRGSHQHVQGLWYQGDAALSAMSRGVTFKFGRFGMLDGSEPKAGIKLPSGAFITLPELKGVLDGTGRAHFYYTHRSKTNEIYGAMLVAICIQALARLAMTEAMLRIAQRYRVVLMTHDELVMVVPTAETVEAQEFVQYEMTRPLAWAPELPLACSVGAGERYGSAKS